MAEIYLAGGCFWGTEHFLKFVEGVEHTEVGYANGVVQDPTYELVCGGDTLFAESVKVLYDNQKVSLQRLLELFFMTIDPTSVNKQGGDVGTQYRTGIFYVDPLDKDVVEGALALLVDNYDKPIVVEVEPLRCFYSAEEYHQDYLDKNAGGYCHISPELFGVAKNSRGK